MSGGGSYDYTIKSSPSPIHLNYFNHLALIIVLYTSNGYRTHAIEIGQGSTRFQLPLLYLPERAAIVTMSLIAANKRRLSITFNRSPTRPIPIFSELNRDHQSRTAGRRRKRSFPFVPSTMPLYCIRFLSSTGQPDRDGETKRGGQRTSERERERESIASHKVTSTGHPPADCRTRLAAHSCSPDRVVTFEEWLSRKVQPESTRLRCSTRNAIGRVRTVSNKQKCFEDDNRRGLESDSMEGGWIRGNVGRDRDFRVGFSVKLGKVERRRASYIAKK